MKNSKTMRKVRIAFRHLPFVKRHNQHICWRKIDAVISGEKTGDYSKYWAMMPKTLK